MALCKKAPVLEAAMLHEEVLADSLLKFSSLPVSNYLSHEMCFLIGCFQNTHHYNRTIHWKSIS